MKKVFLAILILMALPLSASHIVGGEFELKYLGPNRYRLNLILYFDKINGVPGAKDFSVNARIFRKRDNAVMISLINLPLVRESAVSYTQPECSNGEIVTDKLEYSREIELSDDRFSDPAGYYVVWERCCRNYQITNVVSLAPPPNVPNFQNFAGQTFIWNSLQSPAMVSRLLTQRLVCFHPLTITLVLSNRIMSTSEVLMMMVTHSCTHWWSR